MSVTNPAGSKRHSNPRERTPASENRLPASSSALTRSHCSSLAIMYLVVVEIRSELIRATLTWQLSSSSVASPSLGTAVTSAGLRCTISEVWGGACVVTVAYDTPPSHRTAPTEATSGRSLSQTQLQPGRADSSTVLAGGRSKLRSEI